MRRTIVCAGTVVLSCVASFGQGTPEHHKFDSTDVHASKAGTNDGWGYLGDGKAEFHGGTLLDMIAQAYGLDQEQILGGPVWLDRNRFEVTAKAAPTTPQDDLKNMFQVLLADRFGLVVRKEEKAQPVFVLAVAKRGVKMRESSDASGHGCNGRREGDLIKIDCRSMTIATFAQQMRGFSGGYIDHSVLDRTGLTAAYDFTLSYTPRGQLRKVGQDGATNVDITFFDALEKQVGLHLEKQQLPMPVIVIDLVNEKPTENPNAVTKAAPAEPTEFEVATIKPTNPEVKQQNWRQLPGGQLQIQNIRLKDYVLYGYDLQNEDRLVGAPKWMEEDHYDLVGKTIPNVSDAGTQVMVRNLIIERFKLETHEETQPVPVFALTVSKPGKLKPSDGTVRSTCKNALLDGARALTCQNTTLEELAAKLRGAAPAYIDKTVVDLTGLKGSFDFELKWAPRGRFEPSAGRGGDQPAPPPASASPSDPNGDMTVFEALEKQLGLKLVQQKHPMQVLVIDHIERKPSDN